MRTGVTAIHPRGPDGTGDPVAAGFHSQNGNGEMTGVSWINESGTFTGPVAITNTHAVGVAHAGIVAWTITHHPEVAETVAAPGGRRDLGRLAQRHQRAPRHRADRGRRDRGRRGRGRWRRARSAAAPG